MIVHEGGKVSLAGHCSHEFLDSLPKSLSSYTFYDGEVLFNYPGYLHFFCCAAGLGL